MSFVVGVGRDAPRMQSVLPAQFDDNAVSVGPFIRFVVMEWTSDFLNYIVHILVNRVLTMVVAFVTNICRITPIALLT